MFLTNATGTDDCDAATSKALQGVHLSAISPADLDADDKSLLVNKAVGASTINPVFIRLLTTYTAEIVDLSAPWGVQARSPVEYNRYIYYQIQYASKTGIVDAQNYAATINYTMHYN
jgi:major type 1 subunit fimbrin (pilin)